MGLRLRILLVSLLLAGASAAIVVTGVVAPKLGQFQKVNAELASASLSAARLASDFVETRQTQAAIQLAQLATHDTLVYPDHAEASAMLKREKAKGPAGVRILALDAAGRVVAGTEAVGSTAFAKLPVVLAARKQTGPLHSEGFAWPGSGVIAVATACRYRYYDRQGEHWGVLVRGSDLGYWQSQLNHGAQHVALYDKAGRRLLPPTRAGESTPAAPPEAALALAGQSGSHVGEDRVVTAYADVHALGWAVVASTAAAETLLPLDQDIWQAARFGVLALAISALLAFFVSGFLVAPIRRLEAGATALAQGEWDAGDRLTAAVPDSGDELGRLAAAFGAMAGQLRERFAEIEAVVAQRTKELARTNAQLSFAVDELKALDELKRAFLDAVSHELRTPLNFIMGYGSGLEDGLFGELNEEQGHAVKRIMEGSDRLLGVVNDLIEVSKLEAGELALVPAVIDPNEVALHVASQLECQLTERQHEFAIESAYDLPPAWADPERVAQILRQLLSNACKFTEPGGKITIAIAARQDKLTVEVRDTGAGIPEDVLPHIWESFRRATAR